MENGSAFSASSLLFLLILILEQNEVTYLIIQWKISIIVMTEIPVNKPNAPPIADTVVAKKE